MAPRSAIAPYDGLTRNPLRVKCFDRDPTSSLCRGFEPGAQNFDVDLGADDSGAGLGEADLGFHQLALEGVEFVGRGAWVACSGG